MAFRRIAPLSLLLLALAGVGLAACAPSEDDATGDTNAAESSVSGTALAHKAQCDTCHAADKKVIGPSYKDIAARYAGQSNAAAVLAQRVRKGSSGKWGVVPMPPIPSDIATTDEIDQLVQWILTQKPRSTTTSAAPSGKTATDLTSDNGCLACHAVDKKVVGPAFTDISRRFSGRSNAEDILSDAVRNGGSGDWGAVPMPPAADTTSDADIHAMVRWILSL